MNGSRLGIAGVGLIGGSIGLRARAEHAYVIGYDRDASALRRALARGVIDASASSVDALFKACETLVVALPVDATVTVLEGLADSVGPLLVIDVASVKTPLVAAGLRLANYVGTHPMAGRERGGIDAADAELFSAATWAYVPAADSTLRARVRAFILAMGAVPLEIAATEHDEIVALTSHLPQALSVLLGAALAAAATDDRRVFELCGPGMMSMLRLARSPQATWLPIVRANAAPLAQCLQSLAQALERTGSALQNGDTEPLMAAFEVGGNAAVTLEAHFAALTPPSAR